MSLNRNLTKAVVTKHVLNAVAAGTTNQTSSAVDTLGAAAVRFIADIGTLTSSQVTKLKVQESSDDGATDAYADVTGSETAAMADADSNKLLIVDIYKPQKRWIRPVVNRATANAVITAAWVELYLPDFQPVATVDSVNISQYKTLDNPA